MRRCPRRACEGPGCKGVATDVGIYCPECRKAITAHKIEGNTERAGRYDAAHPKFRTYLVAT